MIPNLINKQTLQLINRKTLQYPLSTAEKDYFLAVVLKIISESPIGQWLIFKGGTAIHHCYLPQTRFSEDLDFTSLDQSLQVEEVCKIFEPFPFLEVKKLYTSPATIKIEKLKYSGILDLPNSLKVEIDHCQNVILASKHLPYHNVWGVEFKATVMDIQEIFTEKLRAMSDRARYRDFYDFYLIDKQYRPDFNETIELLKHKEIRKRVSKESILANWKITSKDRKDKQDLIRYRDEVIYHEEWIQKLLDSISFDPIEPTVK